MSAPMCSQLSQHVSMPGSAPTAQRWWLIESFGSWGSHAVRDSATPWIRRWAQRINDDARVLLIRHAREHRPNPDATRRIFTFTPQDTHVLSTTVRPDEDLSDLDLTREPTSLRWSIAISPPRLLVCTNGKRDLCCAQLGRSMIASWEQTNGLTNDVWECTHLGGHRFAPTAMTVPAGYVLGRLTADTVPHPEAVIENHLPVNLLRGRSDLPAPAQVADIAVRQAMGYTQSSDILDCSIIDIHSANADSTESSAVVEVVDARGSIWRVLVREQVLDHVTASCGAESKSTRIWSAVEVAPHPAATSLEG